MPAESHLALNIFDWMNASKLPMPSRLKNPPSTYPQSLGTSLSCSTGRFPHAKPTASKHLKLTKSSAHLQPEAAPMLRIHPSNIIQRDRTTLGAVHICTPQLPLPLFQPIACLFPCQAAAWEAQPAVLGLWAGLQTENMTKIHRRSRLPVSLKWGANHVQYKYTLNNKQIKI